ncbi:MAG: hypothetical protein ABSB65_11280 [Candidatus Acidiferrales bacterium]|jgi:hypothetical protein
MKSEGLRKVRWIAFALAALGILETPFVIPNAMSQAMADHRLIVLFVMAFAIRIFIIGLLSKVWWDNRADANASPASPNPRE